MENILSSGMGLLSEGYCAKDSGGASSASAASFPDLQNQILRCTGESCYKTRLPKNPMLDSNKKKYLVCHRCKKIANDQWYNGPLDGELICKNCFYKMYNHILEHQQHQQ